VLFFTTFNLLQHTNPIALNVNVLNHRPWYHLSNTLKTYCEQVNCQRLE